MAEFKLPISENGFLKRNLEHIALLSDAQFYTIFGKLKELLFCYGFKNFHSSSEIDFFS